MRTAVRSALRRSLRLTAVLLVAGAAMATIQSAAAAAGPAPSPSVATARWDEPQGVPGVGPGTAAAPIGPAGSGRLPRWAGIAASTVIARATSWTSAHVPYDQTAYLGGYRTDCSGFVSMAWGLTDSSGSPVSLVTWTLPGVATPITADQLLPGDALIYNSTADPVNGSHAVLFGGWVDASHTWYYAYDEAGDVGASVHITPYPYYPGAMDGSSTWVAYRYTGIVSDMPAVTAVPPAVPLQPGAPYATSVGSYGISIAWGSALAAASYTVLRDGVPIATTTATSYTDGGLPPSTPEAYVVVANDDVGASPPSPTTWIATDPAAVGVVSGPDGAYWVPGTDGSVTPYGGAGFYGSMAGSSLNRPVVGMAATQDGAGYWLVASDGGIFAFGDAGFHGSTGGMTLNKPVVGMAATPDGGGYWLVASDGGIFAFGDAGFRGSTGAMTLNAPIVGMAATPDGGGYWLVASDGGIFAFGDAGFRGSGAGLSPGIPVSGIAVDPSGLGYWLVTATGSVEAFGVPTHGSLTTPALDIAGIAATGGGYVLVHSTQDAGRWDVVALPSGVRPVPGAVGVASDGHGGTWVATADGAVEPLSGAVGLGSMAGATLNRPVVGIAPTSDGGGYWLVASDGGIFSFGDAGFHGSTGGMTLNKPIVGMAATPDGQGYWLVASDGGIFAFGDAGFFGSTGAMTLDQPIVGMAATPDAKGYWLLAADGGVFAFGDAVFSGSGVGHRPGATAVAIVAASAGGYWIVNRLGEVMGEGVAAPASLAPPAEDIAGATAVPGGIALAYAEPVDGAWTVATVA